MDGIPRCFSWKQASPHDRMGNVVNRLCKFQQRNFLKICQASLSGIGVTRPRFVKNCLGDTEVVFMSFVEPPAVSYLLPGRLEQVAAWPCGQVAGNCRFNVYAL